MKRISSNFHDHEHRTEMILNELSSFMFCASNLNNHLELAEKIFGGRGVETDIKQIRSRLATSSVFIECLYKTITELCCEDKIKHNSRQIEQKTNTLRNSIDLCENRSKNSSSNEVDK